MAPVQREVTAAISPTIPNAKAFVRSLNVLLKYSRLYGLEHARCVTQFNSAWTELEDAVLASGERGLLLGASGSQLLLDGVPLESTPAERSFADLLTSAGVASIGFTNGVSRDDFLNLVKAFMETGAKAGTLSERLELHFGNRKISGIRVNEIRFVAEDAGFSEARVAATLTAKTLGADADMIQDWFRSPEKMIQLIAAAEGAHNSSANPGAGASSGTGTTAGPTSVGAPGPDVAGGGLIAEVSGAFSRLEEGELQSLLKLLVQFGEAQNSKGPQLQQNSWQQKLAGLPQNAQLNLPQALAQVAAKY